ncbi:MAG TPA: glycosyltransferase family 4 protein [Candidatus Eisenbergiella merdipullorum]|uniref:Glycosyltransferase family 4 protein n=1 Tax=Candidatus Eisenbergiella merdipullorum TaxID=2838553 RepID=A0A9D2L1W1_9FIRM|nr:glycosyltransferase family 4 protein [Candidatus Eisenbergiella merdipullorum]
MKITFVSNYINHHQIPFCDALYRRLGEDFTFIQTEPMEEERVRMGWKDSLKELSYVKLLYEEEELCRQRINECDLLLAGWMEDPELIFDRLESGRPALRISERIYREGQWKAVSPRGLAAKYREHIRYRNKPVYLLCAGAYVASDFTLIHAYPGKMLRFGYFPEAKRVEQQAEKPKDGPVRLLWAGRLMELKHPEYVVRLAADLRKGGYDFRLKIIGGGEMEESLADQIQKEGLADLVEMTGFLPPEEVRRAMEESHIFLFTSNHLEGWGAVVNEAMNSRCAVVASEEAGAVPYLIRHGENGMVYHRDRYEDFSGAVRHLMENEKDRERMGRKACETILKEWNADTAAERCLALYEGWEQGNITFPAEGPLSHAPVIWP